MLSLQESSESYTVLFAKLDSENILNSTTFSVYDDGRDLVAFLYFNGEIEKELVDSLQEFNRITKVSFEKNEEESAIKSFNGDHRKVIYLTDNPGRDVIVSAMEGFCVRMKENGFEELDRRNDWS